MRSMCACKHLRGKFVHYKIHTNRKYRYLYALRHCGFALLNNTKKIEIIFLKISRRKIVEISQLFNILLPNKSSTTNSSASQM